MGTSRALANIIFTCIAGMVLLGVMSFFWTSHSPDTVSKIVEYLSGIVLLVGGAKAGLSLPAAEPTSAKPGTTAVTQYTTKAPEAEPEG